MAWTIQEILEIAAQNGKTLTREQAAFQAHCFNEAEKRNTTPIALAMETINEYKAKQNIGLINTDNEKKPKKPSWQL